MLDDHLVIAAFLDGETEEGEAISVVGDALLIDDWWYVALRLSPQAVIVSAESPPTRPDLVELLERAMGERGLRRLEGDFPLIEPIAYTELSTAAALWDLWATDRDAGEMALLLRAGAESPPPV